jgi:hypothetical protein
MRYVYVENGQVTQGPVLLPRTWNNISNFNALDDQSLKQFGWYPHRFVPAIVDETIVVTGSTFVVENDEVVEYQTTRTKTESEIAEEINQKWINIRSQRAIYVQESDWTQIADVPMSDEKKLEWATYRQSLRDITNYESPDEVVWPEKPSMDDPTYRTMQSPIGDGVINE